MEGKEELKRTTFIDEDIEIQCVYICLGINICWYKLKVDRCWEGRIDGLWCKHVAYNQLGFKK